MMDTTQHPKIAVESIILINSHFKRFPRVEKKVSLAFDFKYKKSIKDSHSGQAFLSVELIGSNESDKQTAFELACTFAGFYRTESQQNMEITEFLDKFAPAHLFPYIREFVSSVSMRSGIPPVILPPLNINVLLNQKKKLEGDVNDDTVAEPNERYRG